jgi:hypothetical protein
MIPFGLKKDQFLTRCTRLLDRCAPQAIGALRALLARELPPAITAASVELFIGDDEASLDAWIYFDGRDKKVDSQDPGLFPGQSLKLALGLEAFEDFDERYFGEKFGGGALVADLVKRWIAECWWKAGGWSWPLPAEIGVHDGIGDGTSIRLTEPKTGA